MKVKGRSALALERFHSDMSLYRAGGLFADTAPPPGALKGLKAGDAVLRLPTLPCSLGIASAMLSGYSHCGVIVRDGDDLKVADCYPDETNTLTGGIRTTSIDKWLAGDGKHGIYQWLVLRNDSIDTELNYGAIRKSLGDFSYKLVAPGRAGELDAQSRMAGNCSTFVHSAYTAVGIMHPDILRLGDVNRRAFLTFIKLLRDGFYEILKTEGANTFHDLARKHGILSMLNWKGRILPPSFLEMHPGFEVVAYGRPACPEQARFGRWLVHHGKRIAALRAAVHCHGLNIEDVPNDLAKAAGTVFCKALASQPGGQPINAISLCRHILMLESDDPATYVCIPIGASLACKDMGAVQELAARYTAHAAPALLALARLAGWKPLKVFDRHME